MTDQSNTGVYQHLGHEVSLYSGKTRAYLRYKKIPFDENISAKIYEDINREIGRHDFTLGGITAERAVLPYQQWMFQRPLRCYQNMTEMERQRIDPVLEQLGGLKGLQTKIPLPLTYKNHRVVVA